MRPPSSNFAARRAAVRTEERAARRQPCRAATGHLVGRANLFKWLRGNGAIEEVRCDQSSQELIVTGSETQFGISGNEPVRGVLR